MSITSIPGYDALHSAPASVVYIGEDVLSASVEKDLAPSKPSTASAASGSSNAAPASENPYQAAYSQIMTASSVELMLALVPGSAWAPRPVDDGAPQNALSGISKLMDALKAGMAQGMFAGTGVDRLV